MVTNISPVELRGALVMLFVVFIGITLLLILHLNTLPPSGLNSSVDSSGYNKTPMVENLTNITIGENISVSGDEPRLRFPNRTDQPKLGFKNVAQGMGINYGRDRGGQNRLPTAGVFVSDYDNDALPDILMTGGRGPVLYENLGDARYVESLLPSTEGGVRTALFFDYDNDGWEDLYLLSDTDSVFLENEGGEFVEQDVGLGVDYMDVNAVTAADYTGNGCLDVFVVQGDVHGSNTDGTGGMGLQKTGKGRQNRLFRGNCSSFEETTEEAGIRGSRLSMAASFADLTNNGYPDIHVANYLDEDVVYLNSGDGTFERRLLPNSSDRSGMSSEVADVNGDGYLDILVSGVHTQPQNTSYGREAEGIEAGNRLLINQGNGIFIDRAKEYEVLEGGWGWSAVLEELTNDGSIDLLQGTTYGQGGSEEGGYSSVWAGAEDGFARIDGREIGLERTGAVGVASLDFNLDGRVDIVESNIHGDYKLYFNGAGWESFLQVDVAGRNRTTIGSHVYVDTGDETRMKTKTIETNYMSQSSRVLQFGLNEVESIEEVRVEFPNGRVTEVEDIETNQRISVSRDGYEVIKDIR